MVHEVANGYPSLYSPPIRMRHVGQVLVVRDAVSGVSLSGWEYKRGNARVRQGES
jgi:hypothetical protein